MIVFIAGLGLAGAEPAADSLLIRRLLMSQFDRPDAHLDVGPIVLENEVAIADWAEGDMGGRALLRREHGKWSIVLCGGNTLKSTATLVQAGVPSPQADALVSQLTIAEGSITPTTLARFGHFNGLVRMDAAKRQE